MSSIKEKLFDMNITIVTDCTGVKQDAIKGVFSDRNAFPEIKLLLKDTFPTPLAFDQFAHVITLRIESLVNENKKREDWYVSIQRGYFFSKYAWQLSAIVSMLSPTGGLIHAMTSSVPLPEKVSGEKTKFPSKNFNDLLLEEFPGWNKNNISVYSLLTGEDEKDWLRQPLRYCKKYLSR